MTRRESPAPRKKARIIWIDDEKIKRERDAKILEGRNLALKIDVWHPCEFSGKIGRLGDANDYPLLFLVDDLLNQIPLNKGEESYPERGLTIAGSIRHRFLDYPIYGMTEHEDHPSGLLHLLSHAGEQSFEELLSLSTIQDKGHDLLYHDAIDFFRIRTSKRASKKAMLNLLGAPSEIETDVEIALPTGLRGGLAVAGQEGDGAIAFARWVNKALLVTPGFLYDRLHSATYLGMNTAAFDRIEKRFTKARYSGVFSKTKAPLWWSSEICRLLFEARTILAADSRNPWEIAPKLFKMNPRDMARCAVCGGYFPETVGLNTDDAREERPVHYKCSESHPDFRREPFFDDVRVFKK